MKITTSVLALSLLLAGCHQFQKTKSGLIYKITPGGSKDKLKQGQFVKMNIEIKIEPKDTLWSSSYGHIPAYIAVDTARFNTDKHNFTEVLAMCAPGDKFEFIMNVDSMKKFNLIREYDNLFVKGGSIKGKADIIATFPDDKAFMADLQKETDLEKQREVADLQKYINGKGIHAQKTPNGVFVEIKDAGGPVKPDSGMQASVMYRGTLLENGKGFDKNMDADALHKDPYPVVMGTHSVIPGWEEGLKYFGKGGKGRLFVPASMAYGGQGQRPAIPPNANLVFDIEVVDVTTPPPPPPAPAAPTMKAPAPQKKK